MRMPEEMVFIEEIDFQTQIALNAFERLKSACENFNQIEIWSSIQSILVATGNVSKILWPIKNKKRGAHLRRTLSISQENILKSRKFRDHFEHYDERIEKSFEDKCSSIHIDLAMNPSLRPSWSNPIQTNRGYNSFNNTLVFRDEVLDFNKILKALEELQKKCSPYVISRK